MGVVIQKEVLQREILICPCCIIFEYFVLKKDINWSAFQLKEQGLFQIHYSRHIICAPKIKIAIISKTDFINGK